MLVQMMECFMHLMEKLVKKFGHLFHHLLHHQLPNMVNVNLNRSGVGGSNAIYGVDGSVTAT